MSGDTKDAKDRRADLSRLHDSCGCYSVGRKCIKNQCELLMKAGRALFIDCDKCLAFKRDAVRPDVIALHEPGSGSPGKWLVIEIKTTVKNPREIVNQLQAGVSAIESQALFDFDGTPSTLEAIVLHLGGGRAADFGALRGKTLRFQGRKVPIRSIRCGRPVE